MIYIIDNSFAVQIILLFSILIILIVDFFGFKKKKIIYSFIGIVIVIFSGIEASDSFKTYDDKEKSEVNYKKENLKEQAQTIRIDSKKEINTNESSNIQAKQEPKITIAEIEKNNKNQQIDEKNIEEKKIKREVKQTRKEEIQIRKKEKIEKINAKINENSSKISDSISNLTLLGDNMKYTEKWKERVMSRIWKTRELCSSSKDINHPIELNVEYNMYLEKINKIESILNSLENGIVNDDEYMIKGSFESLKN